MFQIPNKWMKNENSECEVSIQFVIIFKFLLWTPVNQAAFVATFSDTQFDSEFFVLIPFELFLAHNVFIFVINPICT